MDFADNGKSVFLLAWIGRGGLAESFRNLPKHLLSTSRPLKAGHVYPQPYSKIRLVGSLPLSGLELPSIGVLVTATLRLRILEMLPNMKRPVCSPVAAAIRAHRCLGLHRRQGAAQSVTLPVRKPTEFSTETTVPSRKRKCPHPFAAAHPEPEERTSTSR